MRSLFIDGETEVERQVVVLEGEEVVLIAGVERWGEDVRSKQQHHQPIRGSSWPCAHQELVETTLHQRSA